jgi:hypothetical protein
VQQVRKAPKLRSKPCSNHSRSVVPDDAAATPRRAIGPCP